MTTYLATTKLAEFWPKGRPLTFLGKWCLPWDENAKGNVGQEFTVLDYPWDDSEKFSRAAIYVSGVYERLLAQLAAALNDIHRLNRPLRYWRVIIGPWLSWYLEAFYDRYSCLAAALHKDRDVVTIGLEAESYSVPYDFEDFARIYVTDEYNLQLFTQILEALRIGMVKKQLGNHMQRPSAFANNSSGLPGKARAYVARTVRLLQEFIVRRSRIGLVGTGLPLSAGVRLWVASNFRVATCHQFNDDSLRSNGNRKDLRNRLRDAFDPNDEFEAVVNASMSENIPQTYVETFGRKRKRNLPGSRTPRVLVSAMGWYMDLAFKIFAAEAQERGCKLYATQHGGYYGMLKSMSPEVHEQTISDGFYSWGWSDGLVPYARVQPMPALKLVNIRAVQARRKRNPEKRSLVLVATMHPRYLYRFQSHPVGPQWEEYIDWQLRFAKCLTDTIRAQLIVRPYLQSYGWEVQKRWLNSFPEIVFDFNKRIDHSFVSARMLIVDHPATALLEALSADIPTILFWNFARFSLRPAAQSYFDELSRVGLLHDSPESAAAKVNEVYSNPPTWWHQKEIREAKERFCRQFARTSSSWLKEWKAELLRHADG